MMKRRYVLKQIMLATGVVGLFPACYKSFDKSSLKLKNLNITSGEEKLLAQVVDTFIPETDTPGAKELGVHLFVLKMADDCYEREEQETFLKCLRKLDDYTHEKVGHSFAKSNTSEREKILRSFSESETSPDPEMARFYRLVRHRTIQGYLNSEYVMSKLVIYEMVPGRYNGYFPVATT